MLRDPAPGHRHGGEDPYGDSAAAGFGAVHQRLGFALTHERGFSGAIQQFAGGRMFWSGEGSRSYWVLYDNGEFYRFRASFEWEREIQ